MEEVAAVVDHENEINTKISKLSIYEGEEETLINFLDSLDHYLVLIDSLSNTLLRQGWLELAGARYSMGASRVNTALLNLQPHSAATTVEITHDDDGNQESSRESSIESVTNASPRVSNGSKINASPRKIENPLQKERAKVLSMFGTLVSPKLRASQLTFETALETLIEIANARSSILKSYEVLHGDMKSNKE